MIRSLLLAAAVAAIGGAAQAQTATNTSTTGAMPVVGNVPALCSTGGVIGGETVFNLGTIIDTTTGFLLPTLSAQSKVLAASFCNSKSTISVAATPMLAQSATAAAPSGFSNAVNFTATASGWTATPASFVTGGSANASASQSRDQAFSGDITVSLGSFNTVGGPSLRLVADPVYRGTVTVTLAVAS